MKLKISTISISILLVGLLVYGFISLNSNDPYTDYAPGVETSISTSNGTGSDTITPATWPYPVVWNYYHGNIAALNGGTVGACFYKGRYWLNRWNATTCNFLLPTPPPNGGPGGTPTSTTYQGSIRDMTVSSATSPQGYFIWGGAASTTLYKFDSSAATIGTFPVPGASFRAIAYDPVRNGFWNSNFGGNITCYSTTGTLIATYANAWTGKYGMAYDDKSVPDSAILWVWDQVPANTLHRVNVTGTPTLTGSYLFSSGAWSCGGAEAYESPDGTEFWLALDYQNNAVVAYKLADLGPPPDPEYYNYNNGTSNNSFPFNTNNKMIQLLVGPGEFNQPTGAPSGGITHFYCRIATLYPLGPATYSGFNIRMGQDVITTLPASLWAGQLDTVYHRASVTLQAAGGTWLAFTLDTPFPYDSTKSLIVQIQNCGITGSFSGFSLPHTTTSEYRRTYSATAPCPQGYLGRSLYVPNVGINVTPLSGGITPVSNIADKFSLSQNYPNPFNPTTTINFSIPKSGFVALKVFDVLGREVATLVNETKVAGNYTVDFDGSGLSSGVYFYRIEAGDFISMKKMMLTK